MSKFNKNAVEKKIALSVDDIEAIYGVNKGTLANYRSKKIGCRYYKVGAKVFYRRDDFEKWFFNNPVLTTER